MDEREAKTIGGCVVACFTIFMALAGATALVTAVIWMWRTMP
jgi:hypothetical protein